MMTRVNTLRGSVDSSKLGRVLVHEHLFVMHTEFTQNYRGDFVEDERIEDAVTAAERAQIHGHRHDHRSHGPRARALYPAHAEGGRAHRSQHHRSDRLLYLRCRAHAAAQARSAGIARSSGSDGRAVCRRSYQGHPAYRCEGQRAQMRDRRAGAHPGCRARVACDRRRPSANRHPDHGAYRVAYAIGSRRATRAGRGRCGPARRDRRSLRRHHRPRAI